MNIGLHCRLVGRPGRAAALARFLDYAASHEHVWFAKRIEIADHWRSAHPPANQEIRPSELDKVTFMNLFGGVFEHSAWVAERTFEAELGPAHDTAIGLHSAMTVQFRLASDDEKLQVLKAHPDLAGKLAAAKRLTAESAAEQASAGLDSLTDSERLRFDEFNQAYMSKFGFPFIIAVKGLSKQHILDQFKVRIENGPVEEFSTACRQVERIARLRLDDLLPLAKEDTT